MESQQLLELAQNALEQQKKHSFPMHKSRMDLYGSFFYTLFLINFFRKKLSHFGALMQIILIFAFSLCFSILTYIHKQSTLSLLFFSFTQTATWHEGTLLPLFDTKKMWNGKKNYKENCHNDTYFHKSKSANQKI